MPGDNNYYRSVEELPYFYFSIGGETVSKKLFFILLSLLMIGSFVLGACAPAPAPVEEVEEVVAVEEVEEAVEEEMAEEVMGEKIPLTLYYMPVTRFYYPSPKEIAEGMAADMANAGFDVQLELAGDWPTYLGLRREGNLDGLYMLGWGGDNGDPDNFLNYFFGFPVLTRLGMTPQPG